MNKHLSPGAQSEALEMARKASEGERQSKNWVRSLLRVPFGKYWKPAITTTNSSVKQKHEFVKKAKAILDKEVCGHEAAKRSIMDALRLILGSSDGSDRGVIGLQGPPGNGKTSLCRRGIAQALNRPFVQINLAGMRDKAILDGHHHTYMGATYGRIVSALIESNVMNPIIFFDELDKVASEDVSNLLMHLTDETQNMAWQDAYFPGVAFDVSQCLFVFSLNDEKKLSPILRDRMSLIKTKGYSLAEQLKYIARDYLMPRLMGASNIPRSTLLLENITEKHVEALLRATIQVKIM